LAIHLVTSEEKLTYREDGAEIYYRRVPHGIRKAIINRHTDRRGQMNWSAIGEELLEYAVTGWKNVRSGGTDVAFEKALMNSLPETTKGTLIELASGNVAEDQEAGLKNLQGTPDSSPTTTG
jgi:hypothetical protein